MQYGHDCSGILIHIANELANIFGRPQSVSTYDPTLDLIRVSRRQDADKEGQYDQQKVCLKMVHAINGSLWNSASFLSHKLGAFWEHGTIALIARSEMPQTNYHDVSELWIHYTTAIEVL